MKTLAIVLSGLALAACASDRAGSSPRVISGAAPQQEAMFNQIKSLNGKWAMGPNENMKGEVDFAVSSNGSIVREVMFPGTPHEMTNIYHLDGPSIVMTHYCAMGNQPKMRATSGSVKEVPFHFDSVSNLTSAKTGYMGEMTLTFKDKDHVTESWRQMGGTEHSDGPTVMELTRMK